MRVLLSLLVVALLAPLALAEPQVNVASGAFCSSADTCAAGLSCYENKCQNTQDGLDNGLGNDCSETVCCIAKQSNGDASRLVCNQETKKCTPSVPGVTEINCNGGTTTPDLPGTPGAPDVPSVPSIPGDVPDTPSVPDVPSTGGSSDGNGAGVVTPNGKTNLADGAACGNMDSCAAGLSCYNNACATTRDGVDNGLGNDCSATDCCVSKQTNGDNSRLVCNSATNKCAPAVSFLNSITCTAGGTTPPPTGTPTGTPTTPTGQTNLAEGATCGNMDTCATGLSCYSNKCATTQDQLKNGLGNSCSATDCCTTDLVCNSAVNKCAPSVPGLSSISCTATPSTPTTPTGQTDLPLGATCHNVDTCASGLNCYKNLCSAIIDGQSNGFGNTCSASDCCSSPLVCDQSSMSCAVSSPGAQTVTCSVAGNPDAQPTVVTTQNPDGSVTTTTTQPDGTTTTTTSFPASASAVSVSMALIALLAAAAGML